MRAFFAFWVFLAGMLLTGPVGMAQETGPGVDKEMERRVARLNQQVNELDREVGRLRSKAEGIAVNSASNGLFLFLSGAFCALWAQNTNRSSVLWFFLGFIFHIVAVIVLLVKNSNDRERKR